MKPKIEAEAARMRTRAELSPGSGGWQRRKKQVRTEQQKEIRRRQQRANREAERKLAESRGCRVERIHPEVLKASADELIAAGFGECERYKIPANWKEIGNVLVTYGNLNPSCNVPQDVQMVTLAADER